MSGMVSLDSLNLGDLPPETNEDDYMDEEEEEKEKAKAAKAEKGEKKKKKKKALPGEEGEGDAEKVEKKKKKKKALPGEEDAKKGDKKEEKTAAKDEEASQVEEIAPPQQAVDTKHLQCRFYEDQYPEIESLVMVNVRHIAEMGAYVSLLEYNNIEGMILLSELSRRRIRSINKLIRVNRNEVVMVLRVDKEKGYIDLSKRRVSPEDIAKCEDRYNKSKAVHSVLRHLADQRKMNLQDLYEVIGWPLDKKYGHSYNAFKMSLSPEQEEDPFEGLEISEDLLRDLKDYIKRRLSPQPIKIRSDIEVSCYNYEGIDAVRKALIKGIETGTEQCPVKIRLIAPPIYVMSCMTLDKELGIALLQQANENIQADITAAGGGFEIKMAPKAVSQREETELQAMMERLAAENEEVDGDAPEED